MKKQILIDTHAHLGYWPTLRQTQRDLLKSVKSNGVNFTLLSFDGTEFPTGRFKAINQIKGSSLALKFVQKHPEFGMLVWIRPNTETNFNEVDEFINKNRQYIYGIKIHPFLSRLKITDKLFNPYLEIARKYHLPVLVHTATDEYSRIKYLEKRAQKDSDLIFIAAHLELSSNNKQAVKILSRNKNIYGDSAWVHYDIIKELKKYNVLDKFLFGTDNPIDGEYTLKNQIYQGYINNLMDLSKNEYDHLMYKTALKVYKINLK